MSKDDRTPTTVTETFELPDRPLVENDRRARYDAAYARACRRSADRGVMSVLATFPVVIGIRFSAWFMLLFVAVICVGYLWTRKPMVEFERAVRRGLP